MYVYIKRSVSLTVVVAAAAAAADPIAAICSNKNLCTKSYSCSIKHIRFEGKFGSFTHLETFLNPSNRSNYFQLFEIVSHTRLLVQNKRFNAFRHLKVQKRTLKLVVHLFVCLSASLNNTEIERFITVVVCPKHALYAVLSGQYTFFCLPNVYEYFRTWRHCTMTF